MTGSVIIIGAGEVLYERHARCACARYPAYETSPASFKLKGGEQTLTAILKRQVPARKDSLKQVF